MIEARTLDKTKQVLWVRADISPMGEKAVQESMEHMMQTLQRAGYDYYVLMTPPDVELEELSVKDFTDNFSAADMWEFGYVSRDSVLAAMMSMNKQSMVIKKSLIDKMEQSDMNVAMEETGDSFIIRIKKDKPADESRDD